MGQITSQLGQLFAQSIPTIVFVFLLLAVLNRLFFKPLSRTMEARAKATSGALEQARQQAEAAEEKSRQYERSLQGARQGIYRVREQARRDALNEREAAIQKARSEAEASLKQAQRALDEEVAKTKVDLGAAVESLAAEVTETVLAPSLNPGGQGGVRA